MWEHLFSSELDGSSIYEPSGKITSGRFKEDRYNGEDSNLIEDSLLSLLSVLVLLPRIENELLEIAVVETVGE